MSHSYFIYISYFFLFTTQSPLLSSCPSHQFPQTVPLLHSSPIIIIIIINNNYYYHHFRFSFHISAKTCGIWLFEFGLSHSTR
jgi:hypothetical protein